MSTLQPLPGHVLVKYQRSRPAKSESGIVLPKAEKEPIPSEGKVYARAEDVDEVRVHDHIYFDDPSPTGFEYEGKKFLRIHKKNITAVANGRD